MMRNTYYCVFIVLFKKRVISCLSFLSIELNVSSKINICGLLYNALARDIFLFFGLHSGFYPSLVILFYKIFTFFNFI